MSKRRIAHKEIDDAVLGTARTGIAEEVVDVNGQKMVVGRFDDGKREIFDTREIKDLGPEAFTNRTPVITRPRHLWALAREPLTVLSFLLGITLVGSISVITSIYGLTIPLALGALVAVTIYSLAISKAATVSRLHSARLKTVPARSSRSQAGN